MPAKIDPKTGMPVELVKAGKKQAKIAELEHEARKGREIMSALKSKAGQLFENHCRQVLEQRIAKLVSEDPECQAVVKVLRSIGVEIKSAEYANKLLEEQLKQ